MTVAATTPLLPSARTVYSYGSNGGITARRYEHRVNFVPDNNTSTIRGLICFAMPVTQQPIFFNGVCDHNIFDWFDLRFVEIRAADDRPFTHLWMTFKIKSHMANGQPIYSGQALQAARIFLNYLEVEARVKIIWKEDRHGYEINQYGDIKRHWALLPF